MNRYRKLVSCMLIGASIGLAGARPGSAVQPPFPDIAGPELWIDGPLADQVGGVKAYVDVAVDNRGQRVHVWSSAIDSFDILFRRWSADGNPIGFSALVNDSTTSGLQDYPRVAISANGSFLVIFDSREPDPGQGGALRFFVRSHVYDSIGTPQGPEQLVTDVAPASLFPSGSDVAALRAPGGAPGGYIVVWGSNTSAGSDANTSIQGSLVNSNGVPGAQFQVNSDNASGQTLPSVTELADGGFLVVWSQTSAGEVWGRRFNAAAGPIGNDFQISTAYDTGTFETDAAIGREGSVLVVWADRDEPLPASDALEIRGRLFDSELTPLGPDFRINTLRDEDQRWPRVADYGPAGFVVTWQSEVASGADQGNSIEARLVTGPNQFDGPQVQFNVSDSATTQGRPGSHGWYGHLTSSWVSPVKDGEPPNNKGFVIGRDVDHCIYCDDLEWHQTDGSGNLWRWSDVVGQSP
jgi:hypothetical protein